ncbi:MAG: HNH endonuclease [Synergistaceae bacterium]|nr:HNH endonuclease [Synergistaceae bacterium]
MLVYVCNKHGEPLMPCSPCKAKKLLKQEKAKVIRKEPFTIQLLYGSSGYKQKITLGVDTGSKHIGLSATTKDYELFSSDVELRTGKDRVDITNLLTARREARRTRRNRKTRYRPARFDNRVRSKHKGWLAPSVEQRINSHLVQIEKVHQILPVKEIIIETAQFDVQKIRNPEISGIEYQQGEQLGFWNVREYVLCRDDHKCQYCKGKSKDKVLNVHHLVHRSKGGTDRPDNLITLCETCHKKYHAGEIKLKQKSGMNFKDASAVNIMKNTLLDRLRKKYPIVKNTYGYITKNNRIHKTNLPKEHYADAYCITGNLQAKKLPYHWYQMQIRKHCRQLHDMSIKKGGVRMPFRLHKLPKEIFGFRTYDKVIFNGKKYFIRSRTKKGQFTLMKSLKTKETFTKTYKELKLFTKAKTYVGEYIKNV